MTARNVTHATFAIERTYPAAPAHVFKAFADPKAKAQWFKGPDEWQKTPPAYDFRVGGRETNSGGPKGGPVHHFEAIYQDIVPDNRIIYAYQMMFDDIRISVSLATIEFHPAGQGTRLVMTEQGAFLDGYDDAGSRERGTRELLGALARALETTEEKAS